MQLKDFVKKYPRFALAFSGGVDSAYLLACAREMGAEVKAYFVKSEFQTKAEVAAAIKTAADLDAELSIIEVSFLPDSLVADNLATRCYQCKRLIFSEIIPAAKEDGFTVVADGSNASDDPALRPGMKALEELGVYSPLRLAGIKKEEVRISAKEAGLDCWDLPSNSCLATRIKTGEKITEDKLFRIEKAEAVLNSLGLSDLRAKYCGGNLLIQIKEEDFFSLLQNKNLILEQLHGLFATISLDLKARSRREE